MITVNQHLGKLHQQWTDNFEGNKIQSWGSTRLQMVASSYFLSTVLQSRPAEQPPL